MFDHDQIIEQLTKIIDDATTALGDLCESGETQTESCNLWKSACKIERRTIEIKKLALVDQYMENDTERSERSLRKELNL